jgi:MFS transporter, AAHS family, benzoate transport protein
VSTTSERGSGTAPGRSAGWAPLCWIAVLLYGSDLVVVGTVVPVLQEPEEWVPALGAASVAVALPRSARI